MITVSNAGPLLVETNYWHTEHARAGYVYMSANAGAWRLLLPTASAAQLAEMRTGKSVLIEKNTAGGKAWDIVFEDGTDSPFCVTLGQTQFDRAVASGPCRLLVYTPDGLQLDLPCTIKA